MNQLLTELDGVGGLKGVCVLAATSRWGTRRNVMHVCTVQS